MTNINDLTLDEAKLRDGCWWSYRTKQPCVGNVPTPGIFCARVKPRGPEFFHERADLLAPYEMAEREGKLPDEANAIIASLWAKYVFLDWSGLVEDGQDLPYSKEKAAQFMREDRYRLVRAFIAAAEASETGYLKRAEEQAKGN